jgi:hypothetical protein
MHAAVLRRGEAEFALLAGELSLLLEPTLRREVALCHEVRFDLNLKVM